MATNTLKYIIASLLLFAGIAGNAATGKTKYLYEAGQQTRFSPVVGLTSFSFTGDAEDTSQSLGFMAGALVDIGQSAIFQTGLLYSEVGSDTGNSLFETDTVLTYLSVPLFAKFYTSASPAGFYIKGGLMPGLLLSANQKSAFFTKDVENEFNEFDLQGVAGFGAAIQGDSGIDFFFEATFNRSFVNVVDRKSDEDDRSVFNQGFMLSGGVTL